MMELITFVKSIVGNQLYYIVMHYISNTPVCHLFFNSLFQFLYFSYPIMHNDAHFRHTRI